MNRQDYLNQQRYHNQKIIPVQKFTEREIPLPDAPLKQERRSWVDMFFRRFRNFGKTFKRIFSGQQSTPEPKQKIALPKQAIQAQRDHGYLWGGRS